ncbi:MAG: NAD(P)-dependent oxidoreductase [Candidatus Aminicenantes bacterium]|nr:NAD(P)-dependent oxidoreductase [Candidatus Aminicenantes bacterium]
MKQKKIFITGISGCVGHYLFDLLANAPGVRLFLLVRSPDKICFSYKNNPRIEIINDSMQHIHKYENLLKKMEYVVHLAVSWGGRQVYKINVEKTLSLFSSLDPETCRKVIYFSTASILNENNRLLPEAGEVGTDYIKSKYHCFRQLPGLKIYDKIYTLCPTVILGGNGSHPYAHASKELKKAWKYLPLIKFIKIDGSFHFIHALDAALMVEYLLKNTFPDKIIVPGNPVLSVNECIDQLCRIAGIKRRIAFDMTGILVRCLPVLLKKRLSAWDIYSLKKRHFCCKTINLKTLGLSSNYDTLAKCLSPSNS